MTAATLFTIGGGGALDEAAPRLLSTWMLPPWVSRQRGTFVVSLINACGREIDRMAGQHRRIASQAFIAHTDFMRDSWDRQMGLAIDHSLSRAAWTARALARKRGLQGPIGAYLQALVMAAVEGTALPSIFVGPGLWSVFRLPDADDGWPGDDAFLEAERRLALSGPAAFGNWLLPHARTTGGLLAYQLDWLKAEAWDVATYEDLNGN